MRLLGHQAVIGAAARHQLGVAAGLGDAAFVDHQNAVGVDHAGQAVGEDQRGASPHQAVERLLDDRLVAGVDRRERLVEHQDRRVAQQRPGDGDALALAARQADAALADHRAVALGKALDEVAGVGGAHRGVDLLGRRVGLAEAQILLDRAVKQVGVLADHGEPASQVVEAERANVVAADADAPLLGVVEA